MKTHRIKHIEHLEKHMELNEGTMESNKVGNTLNTPLEILLGTCEEKKIRTPLKRNHQILINLLTHPTPCLKRMKKFGPILFTVYGGNC
jgi:hypothetical protein